MTAKTISALLAGLLLFAGVQQPLHAAEQPRPAELVTSLDNGGQLRLTTRLCQNNSGKLVAYAVQKNGFTSYGCWKADREEIEVDWGRAGLYRYDLIGFQRRD